MSNITVKKLEPIAGKAVYIAMYRFGGGYWSMSCVCYSSQKDAQHYLRGVKDATETQVIEIKGLPIE